MNAYNHWFNSGYDPRLSPEPYISNEEPHSRSTWDDNLIFSGDTVVAYEYKNCVYTEFYTAKVIKASSCLVDDEEMNFLTLLLDNGEIKKYEGDKPDFYTILKQGDVAL